MYSQKLLRVYYAFGTPVHVILQKLPFGDQIETPFRRVAWRFVSAKIPNPLFVQSCYLYWHQGVREFIADYASGGYEKDTRLLLESLCKPGMVMVDVGASIGYFSLSAAKQIGEKGKVYSFEPQHINCEMMRKSIAANGLAGIVTVIEKAVADKSCFIKLYFTEPGEAGASLYSLADMHRSHKGTIVDVTTLDGFFESEGWPPVHIIKMDVEGAEKAALMGMKQLVARNPNLKMIIEFSPKNQANAGVGIPEFFDTLMSLGFSKLQVIRNGLQPVNIPDSIPQLSKMEGINLFCERPPQ